MYIYIETRATCTRVDVDLKHITEILINVT